MTTVFVKGNEACVLGALDAGARFFAGYPITPASEIAEMCSEEMPKHGGMFVQMEDEIGSLAAVIGASLGGMKAFTATSGPGMSLMAENQGVAIVAEVPCVIVDVQRYGVSTGVATRPSQGDMMQARWGTHGDHTIIAIAPSTVQECYDMMFEAFGIAQRFSAPVLFMLDGSLGRLREKILRNKQGELKPEDLTRPKPSVAPEDYLPYKPNEKLVPELSCYGDEHILRVTSLMHDERGYSTANPELVLALVNRLEHKITHYQEELPTTKYYGSGQPEIVVISYGSTSRAARAALQALGKDGANVGVLDLKTIWPFPQKMIQQTCVTAKTVFVAEMNKGQIVGEVERALKEPEVIPILRYDTKTMQPQEIENKIREVLK